MNQSIKRILKTGKTWAAQVRTVFVNATDPKEIAEQWEVLGVFFCDAFAYKEVVKTTK